MSSIGGKERKANGREERESGCFGDVRMLRDRVEFAAGIDLK